MMDEENMEVNLQLFLPITMDIELQNIKSDIFGIYTDIIGMGYYYPLFNTSIALDSLETSDTIEITTSIANQDYSYILPLSLEVSLQNLSLSIDTSLIVISGYSDGTLFDIYTVIDGQDYAYEVPISLTMYNFSKQLSFDISVLNIINNIYKELFDMNVSYEVSVYNYSFPISAKLPLRSSENIIFSMLRVPKSDFIYSLYTNMEVVYGLSNYIESSMIVNSYFMNTDLLCELYTPQYDYMYDVINIECFMYPYTRLDLESYLEVEVIFTRRDIDSYLYTVLDCDKDLDVSMLVSQDISLLIHSILEVDNALINLEDIGRVVIFVDPLWRYEPYVLKNAVGTIFNRAIYMNKQKFNLIYGGSPRANYDICKFATIYCIPHQGVNIQYLPTNSMYNKDQISIFVKMMFSFNNGENGIINKVFIFSDNPYSHTSSYLSPLYSACKLYKIPIVVITSKGDISGNDPSNPEIYISRHQVDHNYPLEHQPHWVHGDGSKHMDVYDTGTII